MTLPLINLFVNPYEVWTYRLISIEEIESGMFTGGPADLHIKDKLVATITTPVEAARYIASVGADNGLGNFINSTLDATLERSVWRKNMPSRTPKEFSDYQQKYPHCDFDAVNTKVNEYGQSLPIGQILFHGGVWPDCNYFITIRPLSTTFCPQVALRNAEHKGKAYDAKRLDLFVLKVCSNNVKAFVYKRHGTNLGHENEVLIAGGVRLNLRSRQLIRNDYTLGRYGMPTIPCPIYVLEVDLF